MQENRKNPTRDLTVGEPIKLVLVFAVSLMIGLLFQELYSLVDTIIVGRYLGTLAIGGLGASSPVITMVTGFCIGVCNGFAIPVAQCFGAKDYPLMRKMVYNGLFICVIFSIVLTVIISLFCRRILLQINTPQEIFEYSYTYTVVIFLGLPITFLFNYLSGIIRSLGNSRITVLFLVISSGSNIIMDIIFITRLNLGVKGAALATIISQLLAATMCVFYIKTRVKIIKLSKSDRTVSISCIKRLCFSGVPMGFQFTVTAFGSTILQSSVNSLGAVAVTSVTTCNKIHSVFSCILSSLGTTMAAFAGQNTGAGKIERLQEGKKAGIIIGFVISAISILIAFTTGMNLLGMIIKIEEQEILSNAYRLLRVNTLFYPALTIIFVCRSMIQGMGYSALAVFSGVFELIARVITAIFIIPGLGYNGVCFANPIAWVLADIFLLIAYNFVYKELRGKTYKSA